MPLNPIETTRAIRRDYTDYISSILSVRSAEISKQAIEEVKKTQFVKGPFLEVTPPFVMGKSLKALHDEGVVCGEFSKIAEDIHYERSLYRHQEEAVRKILRDEKNVIIATGTGSGKTECYFLPIFNTLMEQAAKGTLKPGVQALLLFPMNALANDQLKKMRQLLAAYPSITFGRYTGETSFDTEEIARRLYRETNKADPLPNEMLSRQTMQATPPHILLTNYAMLEYLLLRPADSVFFDGEMAKRWRYLVVDEVHVYKGANGTEIAFLLRRLKERIRHHTDHDLRCIATSATLGNASAKSDLASFAQMLFDEPFTEEDIITSQRTKIPRDSKNAQVFALEDYERVQGDAEKMPEEDRSLFVYRELVNDKRIAGVHRLLEENPILFEEVAEKLFHDFLPDNRQRALALLVELAASARPNKDSASLLPARYHLFVKSLEGMFLSLYPKYQVYLGRKERVSIGAKDTSVPVFELANCQRCGQEYIVGKISDGYLRQAHELDQPEYYLFTQKPLESESGENIEIDDDDFDRSDVKGLEQFLLCVACGKITREATPAKCCEASNKGKYIRIYQLKRSGQYNDVNTCAMCGSVSRSMVKRFLTANHAAAFAIFNSLYEKIPSEQRPVIEDEEDSFFRADIPSINETYSLERGRKLLIFSDNRQEAAFFAGYLNNKYSQLMWRRIILCELKKQSEGLRIDDLMACAALEADKAGLFEQYGEMMTDIQKRILAQKYVMYEFLGRDRRTGLEGRGYVDIYPEKPSIKGGKWGFSKDETWNILRMMMDTLRIGGASHYPDQVNPKDEFFAPSNREVFFRKEKRDRSAGREILSFIPDGNKKNKRINYLAKLLSSRNIPEGDQAIQTRKILEEIYDLLLQLVDLRKINYFVKDKRNIGSVGTVLAINFKAWRMRYIADGETLYRCEKCGRVSSFSVGNICPELKCDGKLKPISAGCCRNDPYYNGQYSQETILPMIAKEHTAQLTKDAAGEYQRAFERGEINVLSCSTTFELGVDVGELEATFLRNVPPETANYVQRAGRAGRRASSTAFAVTFARRNSHDIHFFETPSAIISGKIAPPYIEIYNEKIASRHINSVVMSWFFKKYPRYFHDNVKALVGYEDDLDAAVQLRADLEQYPQDLLSSIESILPDSLYRCMGISEWEFVRRLIGEDGALTKALFQRKEELDQLKKIRNDLVEQIRIGEKKSTGSVDKLLKTYKDEPTINFLASNGVLPKYGFPIDVVSLSILSNSEYAKKIDLSRDLRIAIAEFAPPGSVVANGKVWTSKYMNTVPRKSWKAYRYYVCTHCKHISPTDEIVDITNEEAQDKQVKLCPLCENQMKSRNYIVPIFGFSTAMNEEPSTVGDERPKRSYATRLQFQGIGNLDSYQREQRREKIISVGKQEISIEYSPNGKLVLLNQGNRENGLWVCQTCGFVKETPKEPKHSNKWGQDCGNKHFVNVSLGHSFATDILRIELPPIPGQIANKYETAENTIPKDIRLSVLYALLDGASDTLGIARNDINGCVDYEQGNAALILLDEASGGAGHVKKIFDRLDDVFRAGLTRVGGYCGCSEETSCYGCLRNYGNQFEHEKLTRGGAKDYLTWLLVQTSKRKDKFPQ